jgi:hypothetical protein
MVTTEKDIKLTRGDSFGFNFKVADGTGTAVTLDACYFSVKENPDDDNYIFQKNLSRGISHLSNGEYYVKIEPEDTSNLPEFAYFYDLQCKIGNDVFTFLKGKLDIKWDVTKE